MPRAGGPSSISTDRRASALTEHLPLVTYTLLLEEGWPAVYVSPQIKPLFGYSAAQAIDDPGFWSTRIHRDDVGEFHAALTRLAETAEPMSVEYRVTAADGTEVWVRDIAVAAREDDGTLVAHGYLADVTHEKSLERELASERAQADAFFRDSSVGLAITDAEGRYVRVNEALARLNGKPIDDHAGHTLAELSPQIAASVQHVFAEVQKTGNAVLQEEVTATTATGERTVLLSVFPIQGPVRRYGRIVVDITEQRRAERERAAAEEQYRRLIEQLPLVTYVNEVDPVRRATFVSPQIEEIYGYAPEEFVDDPTLGDRVIHPDDVERILEEERRALARGESVELEYRIIRKDGAVRWMLDLMKTVCDADGTPRFEQGFLVDITERRKSDELFRAIFDNALEAVVITDEDGRYVDVNDAACTLFGRSRDELLGLHASEREFREFLDAGAASGDFVVVRPDGERREAEYAARANVLPGLHLSVLRDVTQRRELERELWRAQRLESVGRLAGGVAHDFNNMLTAIRGHAQLLGSRTVQGSPEHRHVQAIDEAADRAASLTAQLLAFGRRQMLQARVVEPNRLLEGLADMLGRLAGEGAELALDLAPGVDPVFADPSQVEQVILNLVANAADATNAGDRITVRTRSADVADDDEVDVPAGRYAVVEVADTGSGIEDAAREHLFEPFFTTKGVGMGTGLGLATAYGIVKQSGGTITVDTEPGNGSTFSVYLPRTELGASAAATLLVLEPDPIDRDALFQLLTDAGHRALTTASPAEAAELAKHAAGRFGMVVGDLSDPAAEALVDDLRAARPAVRAISLQKPYTPDEVLAEVQRTLDVT
jgi:two-component system cell cycle sensor histidine kinase/response regulator CckA